jgi:hypothetical protein
MSRFYTETTKENFLLKVKELMSKNEDEDSENYDEGYPYDNVPSIIMKDLNKVNFDWENYTSFDDTEGFANYPVGYKEIKPGFHVFFAQAGGDWEFPICFIFYWGDNKLRAYIPESGNAWNKKQKCAYNSEDYEDENENEKDHNSEIDEEKMIDEIIKHIIKKSE